MTELNFSSVADCLPPQNIEAEESILGGILLDPEAISVVADVLSPETFLIFAHKEIYRTALKLHNSGKLTDLMSVTSDLYDHGLLEKVGGQAKLAALVNRTVSAVNIDSLAELILDKYQRRRLIQAGTEIVSLGYETKIDLETVLGQAENKVFNLTQSSSDRFQPKPISDWLVNVFDQMSNGHSPGLSTGLLDLDAYVGGLVRSDLIVVAGRASMGKTAFATYLANHVAEVHGLPAVFFSAEMSAEPLVKRFLSTRCRIDLKRLIHNEIYEHEWDALSVAIGELGQLPIIIDDTPSGSLTPAKIRSKLRRIQSQVRSESNPDGRLGAIVVDYIQKLGNRAAGNRAQVVGAITGELKDIAKEFDVPMIALAQINRETEAQNNKRPTISQLKDSGDIEQDADVILMLYRDEYYSPGTSDKGIMEIIIGKQRNGPVGTCKVLFDPISNRFLNLAKSSN